MITINANGQEQKSLMSGWLLISEAVSLSELTIRGSDVRLSHLVKQSFCSKKNFMGYITKKFIVCNAENRLVFRKLEKKLFFLSYMCLVPSSDQNINYY